MILYKAEPTIRSAEHIGQASMRTKFSGICEAFLEAGWLLALVIVPLYFDVYSSRVFEPDKLALLRTIATLMALVGVVKWADEYAARRRAGVPVAADSRPTWRSVTALAACAYAVVYLLATALSVVPRTSLWGSYQRMQGTYSTLSYLVIFALLLTNLRRREQLQRLLGAAILASLPVALYGILQHYRLDPLPWGGDTTFRVASTLGNPIFAAAYLIMVIPLSAGSVLRLLRDGPAVADRRAKRLMITGAAMSLVILLAAWTFLGLGGGLIAGLLCLVLLAGSGVLLRQPVARLLLLGVHLFILSAQLTCLFFTQSRGPWLGLGAGVALVAVLVLVAEGRARVARVLTVAALLAGALLLWVNLPNSPLAAFREVPYIGRLGQLLETSTGTGKVRVLIWQGAAEMVASDPGRAVVGYGPESMYVAFTPFYPPELAHYEARNRSPDRAHNEMWDALITTGALGLAAYLALFGSVLFVGVRALGLMPSPGRVRFLLLSLSVGAALGTAVALLVDRSWRFVGVGMPLGILGGLGVYGAALAFRRAEPATASSEPGGNGRRDLILVAALLAGVIAHFLEIHLGIAIAATRTYFWVWAAVLTVLAEGWMEPESLPSADRPAAAAVRTPPRKRSPRRPAPAARKPWFERLVSHPVAPLSLVTGLVLVVMAWDFTTNPQGLNDPVAVIAQSITRVTTSEGVRTRSMGLLWLFVATFLSGGILAVAGSVPSVSSGPSASWWARAAGVFLALAGGLGLAYSVLHARLLTGLRDPSVLPNDIAATVGVIGLALAGSVWQGTRRAPGVGHAAVPIVGAVALVCLLFFADARNLQVVRADVVHKEGTKYDAQQDWATAAALYERAHLMQPEEDFYLLYWGRALLEVAADETDPAAQDAAYAKALSALEQARRLNPLNTDHSTNVARLYRRWAYDTTDEATARSRRLLAVEAYAQAAALSPHNAGILNEWALAYQDLGDLDAAESKYRESLALDPEYAQTYLLLGELYQARGDWQRARENYARATELDPTSLQAWADLGGANATLGDWDAAIAAFRRGLEVNANVPRLWGYLGDAYSRTGDAGAAADAYQRAVALDGGFVEAWRALADHLIRLQRWDEAKAAVERLRELSPDDYTSLRMLAQVAAQEGRLDEGLAYLRQALSLAPAEERAVLEAYIAELETAAEKDGTQP